MSLRDASPWRVISWICTATLVTSILLCILISAVYSVGLKSVKVTALDPAKEPVDHVIPVVKRQEALPDYELTILLRNGDVIHLGAKPDTSAANGLEWRVDDPVSMSEIASLRLTEQDKFVSDSIAEIQVSRASVTEKGYRFDFETERSLAVGMRTFFKTPIGLSISGAVFAVVLFIMLTKV
jgi:hypothetical protein